MSTQILVVDDEPDISALIAYHLARASYQVRTAANGAEALRAVEAQLPDLIVLDLMLPGASGLDILRELRRRPETQALPVILLTAKREEQDRVRGLELGADDYVAKPFSAQELVLRVGAVLRRSRHVPGPTTPGRIVRVGPFVLDPSAVAA
ncbi:MAG TPA: response regulator, partial [Longimicrobiaceae bacterium]|nr:response regulator [Longimicrobiaceae bacterium]